MNNFVETQYISTTKNVMDDSRRTRCEIWTRVMGYHRPISSFNTGKKGEFAERVFFNEVIDSTAQQHLEA